MATDRVLSSNEVRNLQPLHPDLSLPPRFTAQRRHQMLRDLHAVCESHEALYERWLLLADANDELAERIIQLEERIEAMATVARHLCHRCTRRYDPVIYRARWGCNDEPVTDAEREALAELETGGG